MLQIGRIRHKTNLGQHTRHIGGVEHLQRLTAHTSVVVTKFYILLLNKASHHLAILTIGELQVLDICSNDSCRLLVRHIEQLLFVVEVEGILIYSLLHRGFAHNERLDTSHLAVAVGIGVNRDEEVALVAVGNIGSCLQIFGEYGREVFVDGASLHNLYVWKIFFD